jgi:hypothetical protein
MTQHWRQTTGTLSAAEEGNSRSHFWDLTEYAIIVKLKDIEQMNVPKNRIGTTEDGTTTTTEKFLVEEEEMAMAMAARRII